MATLGHATDEAAHSDLALGELEVFGPYTATEFGTITSITARLDGLLAGGTDTSYRFEVYVDSSGTPGAKVAETALATMVAGAAVADVTLAVSSGSITSGSSYWIGIFAFTAAGSSCLRNFYVAAGPAGYAYRLGVGNPPPDPFGTPAGTGASFTATFYLTYTVPKSIVPNEGKQYVGQNVISGRTVYCGVIYGQTVAGATITATSTLGALQEDVNIARVPVALPAMSSTGVIAFPGVTLTSAAGARSTAGAWFWASASSGGVAILIRDLSTTRDMSTPGSQIVLPASNFSFSTP